MLKLQAQSTIRHYRLPSPHKDVEIEEDSITNKMKVWESHIGESCVFDGEGEDINIIKTLFSGLNEEDITLHHSGKVRYYKDDVNSDKDKLEIALIEMSEYIYILALYEGRQCYPFDSSKSVSLHGYSIDQLIRKIDKVYNSIYKVVVGDYTKDEKDDMVDSILEEIMES